MATVSFEEALAAFIRGISVLEPGVAQRHGPQLAVLRACFMQVAKPMPPEQLLFPPHVLDEMASMIVLHGSDSTVAEACCCAIDALLDGEQGRQMVAKHAPLLRSLAQVLLSEAQIHVDVGAAWRAAAQLMAQDVSRAALLQVCDPVDLINAAPGAFNSPYLRRRAAGTPTPGDKFSLLRAAELSILCVINRLVIYRPQAACRLAKLEDFAAALLLRTAKTAAAARGGGGGGGRRGRDEAVSIADLLDDLTRMLKVLPLTFQGLALAALGCPGAPSFSPASSAAKSFAASLLGLHPRLPDLLAGIISDHTAAACSGAEDSANVVRFAYTTLSHLASCSAAVAEHAAASPSLARAAVSALQAGDAELVQRAAQFLSGAVAGPFERSTCAGGRLSQACLDSRVARATSLCRLFPDAALQALARALCVLSGTENCTAAAFSVAALLEQLTVEREQAAAALCSDAALRPALVSALERRLVWWLNSSSHRAAPRGSLFAESNVYNAPEMGILRRLCRAPSSDDDKALTVMASIQAAIAAREGGCVVGTPRGELLKDVPCLEAAASDESVEKDAVAVAATSDLEARADDGNVPARKTSSAADPQAHACSVCGKAQGKDGQRPHLCSGCRKPGLRYCSRACQRANWKGGHREECKALQQGRAARSAQQCKQE